MKNFYAGIVFTIATAVFGKCCYELGRLDEKRRAMKGLKELHDACSEVMDFIENIEKEEKEEA
jgi:hypothetical protein